MHLKFGTFGRWFVGFCLIAFACGGPPEPASPSDEIEPDSPSEPGPGPDMDVGVDFGEQGAEPGQEPSDESRRPRDPPPTKSYEVPDRLGKDGGPPGGSD